MVLWCGAAMSLVAAVALCGATIRTINDTRQWESEVGKAIVSYTLAERTLQLDLLNARAGLLRNYDPVNEDLAGARSSFARLLGLPMRQRARTILAGLMVRAGQQERMVERFKSDNALLQNSLTRFAANENADAADTLSAPIFKLTLDTSPATVSAARASLRRIGPRQEGTAAAQLLSHARLLVSILPEIDALLQNIRAMRMERRTEALRSELQVESRDRIAAIWRLKVSLAILVLLTLAFAIALGVVQRLHNNDLKMQAANERLNAAIAMPLIDSGRANFGVRVQEAVGLLALHVGARRLQLVIQDDPKASRFSWPGAGPDEAWLRTLATAAAADGAWRGDTVIASRKQAKDFPTLGKAMRDTGLDDLVLLRSGQPHHVLIGIEPSGPALGDRRDLLAGVASAIAAIAHGARREAMQLERERLERTLARARRMETIGAMASGVAHNFNNIAAAIGGFAEMGQEHTRSGSAARYNFDEIQSAVIRSRDLVDDILNFAKQGRSTKQPINLLSVLAQAERLLIAATRDQHAFRLFVQDRGFSVMGAEGDLQQVFLNICNNAARASDGRPVTMSARRVVLTKEHHLSHGGLYPASYVVVSITDTGPGIPETVRRRLFEPFFTTKAGGTGLGLSTAWEIVQDHGGTIDVTDVPTGGAQFAVWLPEMRVDQGVPIVGDGARILLLTDPERLTVEEELLAEAGFEPLAFPLTTDPAIVLDIMDACDAVVISASRAKRADALVAIIGPALGARPLLLATTDGAAPDHRWPSHALSYPLRPVELSTLLFEARAMPTRPGLQA